MPSQKAATSPTSCLVDDEWERGLPRAEEGCEQATLERAGQEGRQQLVLAPELDVYGDTIDPLRQPGCCSANRLRAHEQGIGRLAVRNLLPDSPAYQHKKTTELRTLGGSDSRDTQDDL